MDERIRIFPEEVEVDGAHIYELGAVGQIFLTGFRLRLPVVPSLADADQSQKSLPSFRDDHYPIGFKEFVQRICREVGWVKTAHSLPCHKQKSIKGIGFDVCEDKLAGTFRDRNDSGARCELLTNAHARNQRIWAADQLNAQYESD